MAALVVKKHTPAICLVGQPCLVLVLALQTKRAVLAVLCLIMPLKGNIASAHGWAVGLRV